MTCEEFRDRRANEDPDAARPADLVYHFSTCGVCHKWATGREFRLIAVRRKDREKAAAARAIEQERAARREEMLAPDDEEGEWWAGRQTSSGSRPAIASWHSPPSGARR